jgi:hypothetical protein
VEDKRFFLSEQLLNVGSKLRLELSKGRRRSRISMMVSISWDLGFTEGKEDQALQRKL